MTLTSRAHLFSWRTLAIGLIAFLLIFATTTPTTINQGRDIDGLFYDAIAHYGLGGRGEPVGIEATVEYLSPGVAAPDGPVRARIAPWCWRLGMPLLARTLTSHFALSLEQSFTMLSFIGALVSVLLMARLLTDLKLSELSRVSALLAYVLTFWSVKGVFYLPFYIDGVTQMFALSLVVLARDGRWGWVLAMVPFALVTKESLLLLLPAIAAWRYERSGSRRESLLYLALLLVVALIPLALVRVFVNPANEYSPEAMMRIVLTTQIGNPEQWGALGLAILSGTGVLGVVALIALPAGLKFLRANPGWCAVFLAGLLHLLGGGDKERLSMLLLVPLTIFAAHVIERIREDGGARRAALFGATAVFLQLWYGHHLLPLESHAMFVAHLLPMHADLDSEMASGWRTTTLVITVLGAALLMALSQWHRKRPRADLPFSPLP